MNIKGLFKVSNQLQNLTVVIVKKSNLKKYLLQRIGKVDECAAVSWVGDEQQNLRSPELDVLLARVQH
jgi:hypothetical protein